METQLIGIPQAIDAEQVAITRAAIDLGEYTKPLRCGGCKAPVKAVPSHRRGTSRVAAHFSLISRENNDHDDECIYHFDERLGELIEEIRHEVEKTRQHTVYYYARQHCTQIRALILHPLMTRFGNAWTSSNL